MSKHPAHHGVGARCSRKIDSKSSEASGRDAAISSGQDVTLDLNLSGQTDLNVLPRLYPIENTD